MTLEMKGGGKMNKKIIVVGLMALGLILSVPILHTLSGTGLQDTA